MQIWACRRILYRKPSQKCNWAVSTPRDGRDCCGARWGKHRRCFRAFEVSETCSDHGPKLRAENEEIADLLTGLTDARKTWAFGHRFLHLRKVKGRHGTTWRNLSDRIPTVLPLLSIRRSRGSSSRDLTCLGRQRLFALWTMLVNGFGGGNVPGMADRLASVIREKASEPVRVTAAAEIVTWPAASSQNERRPKGDLILGGPFGAW